MLLYFAVPFWHRKFEIKSAVFAGTFNFNGGGEEIRTLAGVAPTIGFQDRPLQPLGYASALLVVHGGFEPPT